MEPLDAIGKSETAKLRFGPSVPLIGLQLAMLGWFWTPLVRAGALASGKPLCECVSCDRTELSVGGSVTVQVMALEPWNNARIYVRKGQRYEFRVPQDQKWKDAGVEIDPNGRAPFFYRAYLSLFSPFKRTRSKPWFALIGSIGNKSTNDAFLIGRHFDLQALADGWLFCFANDMRWFYWNNSGSLTLTITRIR